MFITVYNDNGDAIDTMFFEDEDLPEFLRISTFAAEYGVSRQAMHKYREYQNCSWAETFMHFIKRKQILDRKKALNAHNQFAK
ncbi:hypothetical protein SAR06_004947 [Escherichia coli]|nr:hypothetical protein [Escherichia coli]HAO0324227.1 hypothetical protein [Escherichia coli]